MARSDEQESQVEIRLLGAIELLVDGDQHPVPGSGERALLARLAVDPGRTISADRLIDDLWAYELPDDPRNALRQRVSKLRRLGVGRGRSVVERLGRSEQRDALVLGSFVDPRPVVTHTHVHHQSSFRSDDSLERPATHRRHR